MCVSRRESSDSERLDTDTDNEESEEEEEVEEIIPVEPPKKRRQPKKPGLKHIILADWSEDDDEEEETSAVEKPQEDINDASGSSTEMIENQSPNVLDNSISQPDQEVQKETDNSATPDKVPTTPKYRNIPKKDRRDIILSEFNTPNIPVNEENDKIQTNSPSLESDQQISNNVETPPDANTETSKNNLESPTSAVVNTKDGLEGVLSKEEDTPLIRINTEVEVAPSSVEKQKSTKTISCFDFKDDEEADADTFFPTLSKLKEKYLSPDKSKSVEDENSTSTEQERKAIEQKDEQLVADIENLLNTTITPELLKGETESIPHDVRALPPKERGKRIFKSRNRPRFDKVETEVTTDIQSNFTVNQQPCKETNELNVNTSNDKALPSQMEISTPSDKVDKADSDEKENTNISLSNNDSLTTEPSGNNEQNILTPARDDESELLKPEDHEVVCIEEPPQSETVDENMHFDTPAQMDEQRDNRSYNAEETDAVSIKDDGNSVDQMNEAIFVEDNESIDSTIVEVSEGNSNLPMTDNEHDLIVLAAAETLISIPSKLCAENRLEAANVLQYQTEENSDNIAPISNIAPQVAPEDDHSILISENTSLTNANVENSEIDDYLPSQQEITDNAEKSEVADNIVPQKEENDNVVDLEAEDKSLQQEEVADVPQMTVEAPVAVETENEIVEEVPISGRSRRSKSQKSRKVAKREVLKDDINDVNVDNVICEGM